MRKSAEPIFLKTKANQTTWLWKTLWKTVAVMHRFPHRASANQQESSGGASSGAKLSTRQTRANIRREAEKFNTCFARRFAQVCGKTRKPLILKTKQWAYLVDKVGNCW
jgi:hypothetical protein